MQAASRGGIPIRVFFLAFVTFAYFMPQWADWNIDSRVDLVHAIVDGHTLSINRYHWNTWDKAVVGKNYYSDKAPGTAMLGVPVYAAFELASQAPVVGGALHALERNSAWKVAIELGKSDTQAQPQKKGVNLGGCQRSGIAHNVQVIPWGNRLYPPKTMWALSKYVLTIFVVGLISALFAAFLFWFLGALGLSRRTRWLATAVYAVGTVALPYSSNFYSHQLSAAFLFTAFGLVYLRCSGEAGRWAPPIAGFLLGLALFTEYTVAIIIAVVGLYAMWALRRQPADILAAIAAGALPLVALGLYNLAVFGSPLDAGYAHDFCWSASQGAGFQGFTYPHLGPLFDLTLGPYRGLFFSSPFLLLAAPGAALLYRRGRRAEAVACLAASAIFIVALSAYWGWNGGRVDGPRYLVPAVPFLALLAAFAVEAGWKRRLATVLVGVLATVSLAATWVLFIGGDTFPLSWLRNPIFDWSLPALGRNDVTSNAGMFLGLSGWESLVPLAVLLAAVALWPRHLSIGRLWARPTRRG